MPRFNTHGVIGAGIGGGIVSLWHHDALQPTPLAVNAGGACWLDDDRLLYQHGAELETCRVSNGEIETIDPQGCYQLAAGGGVYAAQFNDGVRISSQPGDRHPGGVGDVGPDGEAQLIRPDGTFLSTGRVLTSIQALGDGSWSALDTAYRPVCSPDVANVVPVPGPIYGLRRCGDFAIYQAEDGARVIVQYASRPVGRVVVAGVVDAFRPDLIVLGDNLLVTYATAAGEPPESLRRFTVPIAALTQALGPTPPPPVPAPKPEDDMVKPTIDVQHFDGQLRHGQPWQAEFVLGGHTAVTVRIGADGNLTIAARNAAGEDRTGRPRHVEVA